MGYDSEYFFNYDDFKKLEQEAPVGMSNWGDHKFDFFEIGFQNGVKAYLFNSVSEGENFINYCNITTESVKYLGKLEDVNDRMLKEGVKRGDDFIEECKRLSDKDFLLFIVPFKLSWEKTYDDL